MSRNYTNRTPFCKVCKDAGCSNSVYESHFPKDRTGATTCPLLLSQKCRNCGLIGHTVKYCTKPTNTTTSDTDVAEIARNKSPFCKVCKDAGEDAIVYESHFPKDRPGATTCPLLMSQKCRNCGLLGHTVRYCTETYSIDAPHQETKKVPVKGATQKVVAREQTDSNKFSILMDDDDDNEQVVQTIASSSSQEEHFPELSGNWKQVASVPITTNNRPTFASVLSVPVKVPLTRSEHPECSNLVSRYQAAFAGSKKNTVAPTVLKGAGVKCWADFEEEDEPNLASRVVSMNDRLLAHPPYMGGAGRFIHKSELDKYNDDMDEIDRFMDRDRD